MTRGMDFEPGSHDMSKRWRSRWLVGFGLALVQLAACGPEAGGRASSSEQSLLVMANASMREAMGTLIQRFEADSGRRVTLVLGATGNLSTQIENGAPADLFFSADEATIARLQGKGLVRESTTRVYAQGQLALIWRADVEPPSSLHSLVEERYRVVAIANPEHAPYGFAAWEALRAAGVLGEIGPRIVQGESVAQAYQFVRTGNADVALVARSVLEKGRKFLPVADSLHPPLRQAAGVLERSRHPAAADFLAFVAGSEGQAILGEYGFRPLGHEE